MTYRLTLSERLVHSSVRIGCTDATGSGWFGSGFVYNFARSGDPDSAPALVTNKHVTDGAVEGEFWLTFAGPDGKPAIGEHCKITVPNFESLCRPHPNPEVDLAVFPLAPLLLQTAAWQRGFFFVMLDHSALPTDDELQDLGAIEDIVTIGYPQGFWDSKNNMPIVRRGITATHPHIDFEGRPEFLVDAACFPGSSGSAVCLFNQTGYVNRSGTVLPGRTRMKLLGIIHSVPELNGGRSGADLSSTPLNLGFAWKSRLLNDFYPIFSEKQSP